MFLHKVEDGTPGSEGVPSAGPVYRSAYAKDRFCPLLEGMQTAWDSFENSVNKYPNRRMLGHRVMKDGVAGEYVWKTYEEVYDIVIKISSAIRAVGVQPKEKCGVYGVNCPEWFMAMEACNAQSMLCVPFYDTFGNEAVEFIINHAEVSIVFAQSTKLDLVIASLPKCATLKTLVSFSDITEAQKTAAEAAGAAIYSWAEFMKKGEENPAKPTPPTGSDLSTIMYTSGTTGEPKGVLLSHESILTSISGFDYFLKCRATEAGLDPHTEMDTYFSFLSLAHIVDRVVSEFYVLLGASIGFWQGDGKKITEDLAALKPTIFVAGPRVFERIHSEISAKISAAGGWEKFWFDFGFNRKLESLKAGSKHDKAAPFFDKLVFNKVKMWFGGKVKFVISGAAPLAPHIEEFLRVVTCAPVVQGYGLTESCAASFIQVPDVISMHGTVGPPMPNIDVRLVSVPELNYFADQTPARGEICIRGKTLFSGYYKRQDLTDEVLVDGWFSTGDIGEWQADGALKIIGRKNMFMVSQGEFVAVGNLESIYSQCDALEQIWVYGNSSESTLLAVCVPNEAALTEWAKRNGVEVDFAQICQDPKAEAHIMAAVNATGKAMKVKGFEAIKGVILEPLPFDVERNLVTPTFKLKRPELLAYYKEKIDGLFAGHKKYDLLNDAGIMFYTIPTTTDILRSIRGSIDRVKVLVAGATLELNWNQCAYLSEAQQETARFLQREDVKTRIYACTNSSESKVLTALTQLYYVVKRGENVVQQCCESNAWPKGALTLFAIMYDVLDISVHLRWWTSILSMVMDIPSSNLSVPERVKHLNKLFEQELLDFDDLQKAAHDLRKAAHDDKRHLLNKVKEEIQAADGKLQSDSTYLLLRHLYTLLTDEEEQSIPQLNKYTHNGLVGKGSFGVVHKVNWCGYDCVLKQYRNENSDDVEVKSLKSLHHPHIVRFLRHWKNENAENYKSHILMERMARDLEVHVSAEQRRTGCTQPFSLPVAIDIMLQVMNAVWHVHRRGIVHRDLKPRNVLVRKNAVLPDGFVEVKLGDFGLAKVDMMASNAGALTHKTGTTLYRAPELSSRKYTDGTRTLPHRFDIWSFGIMCSQILTGLLPFGGIEGNDALLAYIEKGGRPLLPNECPYYLKYCIESCWQYEPENRPKASDMWKMLRIAQLRILGLIDQSCDRALFTFEDHSNKRFSQIPLV